MTSLHRYVLLVSMFFQFAGKGQEVSDAYEQAILHERIEKFHHLKSRKHSPLQKPDRKGLKELTYFDVDLNYKVSATYLPIERPDTVGFMTSSGKEKRFERFARLEFAVHGHLDTLYCYKRVWPKGYIQDEASSLFIPFTDYTNGNTTYGGGRYMDIEVPHKDAMQVILDFNNCYNPYCAYGGGFSCPIPPKENALNFHIKAGERHTDAH